MIKRLSYLFALLILFSACEASNIADVTNGKEYKLYDYYIDEHGNEGIVIRNRDEYILVLSLDETECIWSNEGESVADSDTSIRDYRERGLFLNQRAQYLGLNRFPAFKWCLEKNHSRKYPDINSWILPCLYHRSTHFPSMLQYDHYIQINQYIEKYGGTPIDPEAYYWLSDEPSMTYTHKDVSDYNHALGFSMSGNYYISKETVCKVRAVKYILYTL